MACNPRHPPGTSAATIVTICCNHRDGEYFLHRITRKLGSTATKTVIIRLLPLTNYISGTEKETQRALLGHTNGNVEMHSPSAAAMLTMVAAATIVRFPPVVGSAAKRVAIGSERPVWWNPIYRINLQNTLAFKTYLPISCNRWIQKIILHLVNIVPSGLLPALQEAVTRGRLWCECIPVVYLWRQNHGQGQKASRCEEVFCGSAS